MAMEGMLAAQNDTTLTAGDELRHANGVVVDRGQRWRRSG